MRPQDVLFPLAGAAIGYTAVTICLYGPSSLSTVPHKAWRWLQRKMANQVTLMPAEDPSPWPADGFPGPDRCRPLSTIAHLLTWQPPSVLQSDAVKQTTTLEGAAFGPNAHQSADDPCSCHTTLLLDGQSASNSSRSSSRHSQAVAQAAQDNTVPQRPKLLVCHDMMGGYLPGEALLRGVDCPNNYRLWHWDCVDVFVYFSHHMVTIPPRGWIHAAHQHSVRMLGTFITEFGQGKLRSEVLFASRESAEVVADQLVAVALHYGFEGWLVNIENSLTLHQVAVLQHFVGYLRARMQAELPGRGLVVWYDAVTVEGALRWQNSLTALNAPFFDLADALFVNYNWTPARMPSAGARQSEVYMGVDVFGRGSYGGGGHNVGLALRAAAVAGLSAALFAPGWVLENLDRTKFAELQERWWQQVQADWGFNHAVVHSLPFQTAFNTGAGRGWFKGGALVAQGSAAAAAAASAAGVVYEPCGLSGKSNDSAGDSSNQAALAAVEAPAASAVDVPVQPGKGWFNMLLTDTLPNGRDPITQQVVCGPVVARLVASTAFEGGSCMVLCQRRKQQLPSRGPGVHCPTCPGPQSAASCSSSSSHSTSSSTSRPVALLQLFRTSVAVRQGIVGVRAVYGSRDGSSASLAAFGSVGSLSSSSGGSSSSSDAVKAQAAPLGLWIMVEEDVACRGGGASAAGAAAGASTGSTVGEACRKLLLLPTGVPAPDKLEQHLQQAGTAVGLTSEAGLMQQSVVQPAFSQQNVQLGDGTMSNVIVDWASPAVVQQAGAVLHPVQFVAAQQQEEEQQQQQKPSDVVCISADQLWDMDLSKALRGWMWKQAAWKVSVPAGSRITGIGVAVEVVPEACIASELLITGVLGRIELSYADLNM